MDMDSTPTPNPSPFHHNPKPTSKLPIKRRTPDPRPPPFKFHRIWTEPDEIRFLQGLVDSSSLNLSFPRDLSAFYSRFSHTMSQPYTKSQLSEKLRRLRKKFRVTSTRISKGLDLAHLSLHDRELYGLSKRLWHPDYAATSPFNGARGGNREEEGEVGLVEKSGLVGVKIDFSPNLEVGFDENDGLDMGLDFVDCGIEGESRKIEDVEVRLSEVNVEFEGVGVEEEDDETVDDDDDDRVVGLGDNVVGCGVGEEVGRVAAKVVMDVFEGCLNDARRRMFGGERGNVGTESLEVRWQRQRVAELDAFGSRLRLVLEHCLEKQ